MALRVNSGKLLAASFQEEEEGLLPEGLLDSPVIYGRERKEVLLRCFRLR